MLFQSERRVWRWAAFAATVANVTFNGFVQVFPFGEGGIREIARRHADLFTPAGYAFAIWGLIYAATVAYAVHQLAASQRHVDAHDRIVIPLICLNVFAAAWIVLFQFDLIGWSVVAILACLAAALLFFRRIDAAVGRYDLQRWILLPATLWFGWLSVATLANISVWLVATGAGHELQAGYAVLAIVFAMLLGLVVGGRYRNAVFPLVIAWPCAAIWVARRADEPVVAGLALIAAVTLAAWAAYCALRSRRTGRGFRIFRGPLDA